MCSTECPVCYSDCQTACKLVCGHSFCMPCVKSWWINCTDDKVGCPMCRSNMYFRGMRKLTPQWADEIEDEGDEEMWDDMCEVLLDIGRSLGLSSVPMEDPFEYEYDDTCYPPYYYDTPSILNTSTSPTREWRIDDKLTRGRRPRSNWLASN